MEAYEPLVAMGVAIAAGLLVGLEREQSVSTEEREGGTFLGGARTYPLVALGGAIAMLVSRTLGPWIVVVAFAGTVAFVAISYASDVHKGRDRGLTSEVTFTVVLLLGMLAASRGVIEPLGRRVLAVAATAVVVAVLLSAKLLIHGFIRRASREDAFAVLKFLIAAVVVLPLLPDRAYGPLQVMNPFKSGLMIVLIAGIGMVGYLAVRILGAGRGLGLTGLVGGLVSSTAVTLGFSRLARGNEALGAACAMAVTAASTIMFGRVLVEVAVVHRPLVPVLAVPLAAMALTGIGFALFQLWRSRRGPKGQAEVSFSNPFELSSAVKFGLLFTVVIFVSKAATVYLGTGGTYLAAVLAGTTDVDAITLSMANLAKEGSLSPSVAVTSIMLGVAANSVVKAVMAASLGGWVFGRRIVLAFGSMLAAGGIGIAIVWLAGLGR
jgi:uncharacterized membrane protein (DUF4010 family)